jgi:hypothetical protein
MLVTRRRMHAVTDCRVYRSPTWDSDHRMVVLSMRFRMRAARAPGGAARRAWDSSQLRRPAAAHAFNLQLSDRFGLLEDELPEGADAQEEYDAMASAIREVATKHLPPRGGRRRAFEFTLSQRTLRLMDARQRAHSVWLRSKSTAAKRERNRANRAADAAVQRDRERWIGQQVAEAEDMLRKKNSRQFARACDRLAGRSRSHQIPPAMRDVSGSLHCGPDGVLKAMTESFDKLYGGQTKLSDETLNQLENDVAAFELTHGTEVEEAHGRPPDLAETEACVRALRSAAAPGGDQLDAMLLKCPPAIAWLHRVITAVWRSGRAPREWKTAIITPLYKGKGPRDSPGNYRGISLLSIAGKAYSAILLHRVSIQVDGQLHEAQCGFRKSRGTVDAIFTLRSLSAAHAEYKQCMAVAFVDYSKAYDCINRAALWKVLKLYKVHPHIIDLLEDLHTNTAAAVRLAGKIGDEFPVSSGVRQGCVIAPTLFNVFIDHIVRKALDMMPEGAGVSVVTRAGGTVLSSSVERIVMLMYADDLCLFSHDPAQLALMLKILDEVSSGFGMQINATKTEVMILQADPSADPPAFALNGGEVKTVSAFKYLGSWVTQGGGVEKEIGVRVGRALGVFASFDKIWASKKMRVQSKMRVYKTFVMPHFLYGCETWAPTKTQLTRLEIAHSHCLRRILGVSLIDRHRLTYIRQACDTEPIVSLVAKRSMQWLGHVMRMSASRLPRKTFDCTMEVAREVGRPPASSRHYFLKLLIQQLGEIDGTRSDWKTFSDTAFERAQDRVGWRAVVYGPAAPRAPAPPLRRSSRLASAT